MLVSESKMPKECDRRPKGVTVDFREEQKQKKGMATTLSKCGCRDEKIE